jgi:hypothetical protein
MAKGAEPLVTLRRHAAGAPWAIGDLAALADRLLVSAGAKPPKPTTDRTVRFYVTRGVVQVPFGRGRASTWGYPHLVELLAARLAQLDGEALEAVTGLRTHLSLEALEQWVASRLAVPLPPPREPEVEAPAPASSRWHRFAVSDGVELHLGEHHPLLRDPRRLGAVLDGLQVATGTSSEES